ncbi:MAG: helix-turn-helix transcriptional regulator [Janthinobacterium lividum]
MELVRRTSPQGTLSGRYGDRRGTGVEDLRTRTRVRTAVAELGPVPAVRLADLLGITGAAVRRHLDAMVTEGVLESREPAPGQRRGRGRPAREYVISFAGHDAMPSGYDDMALSALSYLAEVQGPDAVAEFARRRFSALEERLSLAVGTATSTQARVEALAQALAEQGYAASARPVAEGTTAAGTQLCQGHCPVRRVAEAFPEICEAERRTFERVLGSRLQRLATLAHGDHVCTTFVPHEPAPADHPDSRNNPRNDSSYDPADSTADKHLPMEGRRP